MNAKIARLDTTPSDPRIEDYLAGRLDAASEQRFELDMIGSLELQAQVRDAYALRELVRTLPEKLAMPARARHARLPLALAAGLGALAVAGPMAWWAQEQIRARSSLATEISALQQQIEVLGKVQLGLPVVHLGPLRSLQDASAPLLRQTPDVAWVKLSIAADLLAAAAPGSRQLRLLGPDGKTTELAGQWTMEGADYSVLLPLARMDTGSYRLLVEGGGQPALAFPFEVIAEEVGAPSK